MKQLVERFWQKYYLLKGAVNSDDSVRVEKLDAELDCLLEELLNAKSFEPEEVLMQFRFAIDLLNIEAEDIGCVQRNADMVRKLAERYIRTGMVNVGQSDELNQSPRSPYIILDEDHLNESNCKAFVISPGYKISFANKNFVESLNRKVEDVIDRHLSEIIGEQHFTNELRERVDLCFRGDTSRHTYALDMGAGTNVHKYVMSPCYSPSNKFIGVLVYLNNFSDRRAVNKAN